MRKLVTASERAAHKNLNRFIVDAKSILPFRDVAWNSAVWRIKARSRSSSAHKVVGLWFSMGELTSARTPLKSLFGDFIKAVICKRDVRKTAGLAPSDHATMLRAFRYLYEGVMTRIESPVDLVPGDFDAAARAALRRETPVSAYRVGSKLEELARVIDKYGLAKTPLQWKNVNPRKTTDGVRVGREFDERRHSKMPNDRALDALAEISNRPDLADCDLLRQRLIDLLVPTGFRINELLSLARETVVKEPQFDDGGRQALDKWGKPVIRVGLRYWPEKGGHTETQVKWIPTAGIDLVERAIADIRRITEPFASVARRIEQNDRGTQLGEPWDSLSRDEQLTFSEAGLACGVVCAHVFMEYADLSTERKLNKYGRLVRAVRKGDLEEYLVARSHVGNIFPANAGKRQLLSDSLLVVPVNYFHAAKATLNGTAVPVVDQNISDYIAGRSSGEGRRQSIFERLGYLDETGRPYQIRSHQFRHWLNTLAQEGGLGQLEIASWMGRKDVSQNAAYDHVSGISLARKVQKKLSGGEWIGPISDEVSRINDPIERERKAVRLVNTAHITDLGMCIHDWSALPCHKHGACSGCSEFVLVKGDLSQRANLVALITDTEALIESAVRERNDGTYGVNNWLLHHQRTLGRAKQLLAVHDDGDIPDGTIVQLAKDGGESVGGDVAHES